MLDASSDNAGKLPAPPLWGRPAPLDFVQGFAICLMSLAFGLGIAGISNFPLQAGIISAAIGLLIASPLCRIPTLTCGPAAALAPILAFCIGVLGGDNWRVGYEQTLVVIFLTGCLMTGIKYLGWARYVQSIFSDAIIHGMLASIAFNLLSGRLPTMSGISLDGHTFHERVFELLGKLDATNLAVVTVSIVTFTFLGLSGWLRPRVRIFKFIPPQVLAIPVILILGFTPGLGSEHRINLPVNPLEGLGFPDFWGVLTNPTTLLLVLGLTLLLTVVDTAESVGTAVGITKIDRFERSADVNRITGAMGLANMVSSLLGCMSKIPGGAKSSLAVSLGVSNGWPTIIGGVLVLGAAFSSWGQAMINALPQAGLAAIIIFSVMKLSAPSVWRHYYRSGYDQFLVFTMTFACSVLTNDISVGLAVGVVLQLGLLFWLTLRASSHAPGRFFDTFGIVYRLWFNPETQVVVDTRTNACDIHLSGAWVFFKSETSFRKLVESIPEDATTVRLLIGEKITLIDAPTMERFREWVSEHGHELVVCPDSLVTLGVGGTHYRRRTTATV